MSRACVIGAGLGGIALAIRLQAAGIQTTLVDGRHEPGGRMAMSEAGGMRFSPWPETIDDPSALESLWALAGSAFAAEVPLLPVSPAWRLGWPDGTWFDWSDDPAELARTVARFAPGDLAGFEEILAEARAAVPTTGGMRTSRAGRLLALLPDWLRLRGWQSFDARVRTRVRSPRLRQALTFRALLAGVNPLRVAEPAAFAIPRELERPRWWPRGGPGALARAMAALFTGLGGELRLGDPAVRIHTLGNRANAVACASGWREHFDCVASDADPVHTYRTLLAGDARGMAMTRRLVRRRWSPALFAVHFELAGTWPGIPHDTVLFAARWDELIGDIFDRGVLPSDMIVRLVHPTVTDPDLVPPGRSLFSALVPVPHLGKLPIDWETVGPMLEKRVLDEVGRRLIPDIHDRVLAVAHRTPRDAALDLDAWLGSAFGPERSGLGDALHPLASRDAVIENLYLVGTGAGAGTSAGAVLNATATVASTIVRELNVPDRVPG